MSGCLQTGCGNGKVQQNVVVENHTNRDEALAVTFQGEVEPSPYVNLSVSAQNTASSTALNFSAGLHAFEAQARQGRIREGQFVASCQHGPLEIAIDSGGLTYAQKVP